MANRFVETIRRWAREFVLGPGVILPGEDAWGVDVEDFSPEEYGEYYSTSNPVYFCATLRARQLASLPVRFYRGEGDDREEVVSGPAYDLLHYVNKFWTLGRLIRMTELAWCLWGVAYWVVDRGPNGQGQPREIWWVRPDRMRVIPDEKDYIAGFVYKPANGSEEIPFTTNEVVWMPYDNPYSEYNGLAPLAAARIAADVHNAGMKEHRNIYDNGLLMGGIIYPAEPGQHWPPMRREELEKKLEQRFKGLDKAHRWAIFSEALRMETAQSITPRDAQSLEMLNVTLEEACRAYMVPLDIAGGNRTRENVEQANRQLWDLCLLPEARFLAEELIEKYLPLFDNPGADDIELDTSGVIVLQPDKTEEWQRVAGQLQAGVLTINEWRARQGMEPVPWGDAWWAPFNLQPVRSAELALPEPQPEPPRARSATRQSTPAIVYGSELHRSILRRWEASKKAEERQFAEAVRKLFRRQETSILARLGARSARAEPVSAPEELAANPFDQGRWRREFRMAVRALIAAIVEAHGMQALRDLGMDDTLWATLPEVRRFIEERAQRFAVQVNETTWEMLRQSLSEGIGEGEGIDELAQRVKDVMGQRIRSSAETIARTEVNGAANGGTLRAWEQAGVEAKMWVSALIEGRTRETHFEAHGQVVPIHANFSVGAGAGPHPGAIGLPEEDINCLCTMTSILRGEMPASMMEFA